MLFQGKALRLQRIFYAHLVRLRPDKNFADDYVLFCNLYLILSNFRVMSHRRNGKRDKSLVSVFFAFHCHLGSVDEGLL